MHKIIKAESNVELRKLHKKNNPILKTRGSYENSGCKR